MRSRSHPGRRSPRLRRLATGAAVTVAALGGALLAAPAAQAADPVTIDLSKPGSEATLKDQPFKIKEGSKFTMVVTFKVQHEILSGLQYVQVVKRKGIKVGKDSEMLVCDILTDSFHHLREYG